MGSIVLTYKHAHQIWKSASDTLDILAVELLLGQISNYGFGSFELFLCIKVSMRIEDIVFPLLKYCLDLLFEVGSSLDESLTIWNPDDSKCQDFNVRSSYDLNVKIAACDKRIINLSREVYEDGWRILCAYVKTSPYYVSES